MRCILLPTLVLLACSLCRAQTLRSPWDSENITPGNLPYTCPSPPPFVSTVDPGTYYVDSYASIIDAAKKAAYEKATEAPLHFSQSVTLAADTWLSPATRLPSCRL